MTRKTRMIGATLLPVAALALAAVLGAGPTCTDCGQSSVSGPICGTPEPSIEEQLRIEIEAAKGAEAPAAQITMPVYVHIVTTDAGEGDISDATIANQIAILNTAYAGQQSPGGFNTSFRFEFVSTDRTANTAWHAALRNSAAERAMKTALRQGSADDLNLYIRDLEGTIGGYGGFPWHYPGDPIMDGPSLDFTTLPGGTYGGYNLGDVAVHEIGHWLGLYHPYQGGCTNPNDSVSDTPAARNPNFLCPVGILDTCTGGQYKGKDPTMNFMDSTPNACIYQFTSGQNSRMNTMWTTWRAGQ